VLLFAYRSLSERSQVPKENLNVRQLTANSGERFIEWALISPDGKYLAYVEKAGGLFLSSIETGETRVLAPASGDVAPLSWFPDGTQLLVMKIWEDTLWKVSVLTGKLIKVRDNVSDGSLSPDGSHIAFTVSQPANHELWIMGPNGEEPHRIWVIDSTEEVSHISWDPTGQRLVYILTRRRPNSEVEMLIESRDIEGREQPNVIFSNRDLMLDGAGGPALCWLPDGRLIYSLAESPPNQADSNLWALKVDPVKGEVRGQPERVTNWAGFRAGAVSATADGKRLALIKTHSQSSIYVASLGTSARSGLGKVQRLTTDTWQKQLDGWTYDSRALYLTSDRNGRSGIYRQDVHQEASEPVISGPEDYSKAQLSADGASLLYTETAKRGSSESSRLMSVPVEGGTPSVLASGDYEYQCALPPSISCVLSEKKKDLTEFYLLDPKRGPAAQPFKSISNVVDWSLSPDGHDLAVIEFNVNKFGDKGQVHVLSLSKGTDRQLDFGKELDLGKWTQLQTIAWSTDAKGFLVTAFGASTTLLFVGLDGSVTVLFQQGHNWLCCPKAAPNGRMLAFRVSEIQRDAAMIEKF
jgi:Tol biopolymer transport system component